jgi:hydrogenase/urease accessory protein HupE
VFGLAVMPPDFLRPFTVTGLTVCVAVVHGYAHGAEMNAPGGVTFTIGVALTSLVVAFGAGKLISVPSLRLRSPFFGATCAVAGLVMLMPPL